MTAAYEERPHVLDQHDINYSAGEDQTIRTALRTGTARGRFLMFRTFAAKFFVWLVGSGLGRG